MFFLLYVPTIRSQMSRRQMQALAAQLADQVLTQNPGDAAQTPEARELVQTQLFDMMVTMQEQYPQNGPENSESEEVTATESDPADGVMPETPELADMRTYLERCLDKSA